MDFNQLDYSKIIIMEFYSYCIALYCKINRGFLMAYDEGLAQRIREQLQDRLDVKEKKMFGGVCFMVSNHMCCGIVKDKLMARIGPDNYENCLSKEYISEMDFTGKAMKGMIYIAPKGIESDKDLKEWLDYCLDFVKSLPEKKSK
jgi:hypothetical protein